VCFPIILELFEPPCSFGHRCTVVVIQRHQALSFSIITNESV
jgi:hypothetical protein